MRKNDHWIWWVIAVVIDLTLAGGVAAGQTTQPSDAPATPTPTPDQVLQQMLNPNGTDKNAPILPQPAPSAIVAPDSTSGAGALAPHAPPVNLLREGTDIIDRVGRIQKNDDGGQVQFVFDSDGRTLRDPPVIILQNLRLMGMEDAAKAANRDLRFRITGSVTEYRGRNYILLDKAVVVQDKDQEF
jgi:hypothetical protein